MRIQKILAVLLLSTSLVGCGGFLASTTTTSHTSTTGVVTTTTQPTVNAALASAESALKAAEDAHTNIGKLLQTAAESGLLHGDNAKKAKDYYDQAGALLDKAEVAKNAANANGVLSMVAGVQSMLSNAASLIGVK